MRLMVMVIQMESDHLRIHCLIVQLFGSALSVTGAKQRRLFDKD